MEYQVTQSNDHRLEAAENSYCLDQISCDDLCSSLCPMANITESQDSQQNVDGDVVLNATDNIKLNVEMVIPKDINHEENRQTAKKDEFEQMEYYDRSANDNNYERDRKDKFEHIEHCDISAYTDSARDNLHDVPIEEEEKANEAGCFFCPRITPIPFCVFVFLTIFAAIP